ncbi:MAG TPA: PadR family transcriptional regulator [Vicinamibacteria bacterium]|nr:PadR family transcriptional regulator [Vicinamibacteria bacterium]
MPRLHANLLRGTLDLLILRALEGGRRHGYGILEWLEHTVAPELLIEEGTLYPALHRLEAEGWIRAEWGASENNRKAKYYRLTPRGTKRAKSESSAFRAYAEKVIRALDEAVTP